MAQSYNVRNGMSAFVAMRLTKSKVKPKTNQNTTIHVIGCGVGRTGTTSLKSAIEILYGNACYHMAEVIKSSSYDFWTRASNNENISPEEYKQVLKGYCGVTDNPASMMWKELLEVYPDAKVVLAVRDPEEWYKSFKSTLIYITPNSSLWGVRVAVNILNRPVGRLVRATFGKWSGDYRLVDYKDYETNKERMINYYLKYNEHVKQRCPADKLLIYNIKEGWAPLCAHLNLPIPDVPFPHENDTQEVRRGIQTVNIIGWVITVLFFPIVAIVMIFFPISTPV